jgi:hypothetical protein
MAGRMRGAAWYMHTSEVEQLELDRTTKFIVKDRNDGVNEGTSAVHEFAFSRCDLLSTNEVALAHPG